MTKTMIGIMAGLTLCVTAVGNAKEKGHKCITWEKFLASGPELKQIGWLTVRPSKDIASSDWSIGCETPSAVG